MENETVQQTHDRTKTFRMVRVKTTKRTIVFRNPEAVVDNLYVNRSFAEGVDEVEVTLRVVE